MACGCEQGQAGVRQTFRIPALSGARGDAAQVGTSSMYEVLTAAGNPTGRRFTSFVAASGYAARIGGSTRPV